MSLSEVDRRLLDQCLQQTPRAWENFVDRFLGLVVHVVNHTAHSRQIQLSAEQRDDLVADVFLALVDDHFAILRRFRRNCSLATYLAVIARRIVVRRMMAAGFQLIAGAEPADATVESVHEDRIADQEQVQQMMARLDPKEAHVVRMFHLEGKSYSEISAAAGLPENSVGPLLSRARAKLRDRGPA
ncbi:RNA polymerase sigma factor [Roseimaritima sediminicola]|uniref:RNA polymerase sigma factor n=1 Tax=Roseimaritima sediminicola TaxID=2662066 RepID=UPI00129848ED|nr:sigma-70 family RNA polymerase sigma factor [Roseimaritima sediminicola]